MCRLQEKHTREQLRDHLKAIVSTQAELQQVFQRISDIQAKIRRSHQRQQQLLATHSNRSVRAWDVYVCVHACMREKMFGNCLLSQLMVKL